jgi:hypothetical protein
MSAPVILVDNDSQALTISSASLILPFSVFTADDRPAKENRRRIIYLFPITRRNRLTSCWKTITSARTPSPTTCPSRALVISMFRAFTRSHIRYITKIVMKMLKAAVPRMIL